MSNPMSAYSQSSDARDFLDHYKKQIIKNDPRLEDHQDVIKDFGENYERAYMLWNTYYAEAYKDMSYYLGNQWSLEELAYLNNQRRSAFTYNKLRRNINQISGYQRANRLASVITPIEDAAEQTAMLLTDTIQYIMQNCDGYEHISNAFKGALITGIHFLQPYVDYRNDPISGDIKIAEAEWNEVIIDPFMTKRDMSDSTFVARRKYLSRSEVVSMIPDKEDVIMSLPWGSRDDKFTYMPYARQWGMQKLLNYTEYWRQVWKVKDVLVDMQSGEMVEWKGNQKRLKMLRQIFPQMEVIRRPVKTVELGIIVEGQLLYYGEDPAGLNEYPFVPFFAVWEPSYDLYSWKIQSALRVARDSQTELNKRRSKMIDILDKQLNATWLAKTNAVSNPTSLFKSGQGQVIFIKPEAQLSDVQRLDSPGLHPSMFQLEEEFNRDIMEQMGINHEMFGMANDEKVEISGILGKMRQAAGLINLQDVFDGLRQSQKFLSQKVMKLVQLNYTPEKIKLITKKEPTAEFFSKVFSRYDVVVEEGILTDTQKQTQFAQLMALKAAGVQIPDDLIIKNSSLHDKKQLQEQIAAQVQAQQQVQQQAAELEIKKATAETEADQALAAERINKIQLDAALSAERIARADEDRTGGVLNLIRAVKELEGMDLDQLMRKVEILQALEQPQSQEGAAKTAAASPKSTPQSQLAS